MSSESLSRTLTAEQAAQVRDLVVGQQADVTAGSRWLSAQLTERVASILTDGRDDLVVRVTSGCPIPTAMHVPAVARIFIHANWLPDDVDDDQLATLDLSRPDHRRIVATVYGMGCHEAAHAQHTLWRAPEGSGPAAISAATLLEEPRIEHRQVSRRPADRTYLAGVVDKVLLGDGAMPDSRWGAAKAACLLLGRADGGVVDPTSVAAVADAAEAILGAADLTALRQVWADAFTVADDDGAAMIALGERFCAIVGVDADDADPDGNVQSGPAEAGSMPGPVMPGPPDTGSHSGEGDDGDDEAPSDGAGADGGSSAGDTDDESDTGARGGGDPDDGAGEDAANTDGEGADDDAEDGDGADGDERAASAGEGADSGASGGEAPSTIADAVDAATREIVTVEHDTADVDARAAGREARLRARRQTAEEQQRLAEEASRCFDGGAGGFQRASVEVSWRNPTTAERAEVNRVATALRRAQQRGKAVVRRESATPGGRLHTGRAITAAAQRAAGQRVTVGEWTARQRVKVPNPPLRCGIAIDGSGSMRVCAAEASGAGWTISQAVNRIDGIAATTVFGSDVAAICPPGTVDKMVPQLTPRAGSEHLSAALDALDGGLDLTYGDGARMVFIITDGMLSDRNARPRVAQLIDAGVKVIHLFIDGNRCQSVLPSREVTLVTPSTLGTVLSAEAARLLAAA